MHVHVLKLVYIHNELYFSASNVAIFRDVKLCHVAIFRDVKYMLSFTSLKMGTWLAKTRKTSLSIQTNVNLHMYSCWYHYCVYWGSIVWNLAYLLVSFSWKSQRRAKQHRMKYCVPNNLHAYTRYSPQSSQRTLYKTCIWRNIAVHHTYHHFLLISTKRKATK
jgi:hypothetical protein